MYVKASTEVWCCLSKESTWVTNQSCMVWRYWFFKICSCTAVSYLVWTVVGEQAGAGGREENRNTYWHAGQLVCSSLVGYNFIKIILRRSLRQLNLFSAFFSPCTPHHHLLSYLLLCKVLFCLSLFFAFLNSPSLLQPPL